MDSIIILIYVYMFLIGMCVASFMNVVIDRVPRNEVLSREEVIVIIVVRL